MQESQYKAYKDDDDDDMKSMFDYQKTNIDTIHTGVFYAAMLSCAISNFIQLTFPEFLQKSSNRNFDKFNDFQQHEIERLTKLNRKKQHTETKLGSLNTMLNT